ncbi:precorrin-2 C(20)-methyltransferase [Fusibacter sp. 3D3]|uniref:precorrin-2 C(20)-methyltransferase n=1 Tax=Fusibacter sp. 3D3 TaxID=1048380 RepID=UPI000853EA68|nr:precorrin-2 C(20)-methyltransferase [Fusibacter sp. 3D3]GAU76894.1 cobalt-precorrin-2 C20-methyltransferase [Fusibacter sp. 3D3]
MSKFYGIGVGPGDPELLTLKAVNRLKALDILVVPQGRKGGQSEAHIIASPHLPSTVEIIARHFPMTADQKEMDAAIDPIAAEIKMLVNSGKSVGFVTLGDPMLYSTYIYLLKRLKDDIKIETIGGLSSYSAMASGFNRPLVEGDTPLLIYPCTEDLSDLEHQLMTHQSIVLMKVYRNFDIIKSLLMKHDLIKDAVAVSDFSKPNEKIYDNLETVNFEDISYFTTILINKGWQK